MIEIKWLVCHTEMWYGSQSILTKGKSYKVVEESECGDFVIVNDEGGRHHFGKEKDSDGESYVNWFEPLEDVSLGENESFVEALELISEQVKEYEELLVSESEYEDWQCEIYKDLLKGVNNLISLNLWSARRLSHPQHKEYAYDELEKITGRVHERV